MPAKPPEMRTDLIEREFRAVLGVCQKPNSSWSSEQYWEANKQAISRGVEIWRVFVIGARWDDRLRDLIKRQSQANVQIWIVNVNSLDADMQTDMAIWDKR